MPRRYLRRGHWTDDMSDREITYHLDAYEDEVATSQEEPFRDVRVADLRARLAETRRALVVGDDDLPECVLARLRQQRDNLMAELAQIEGVRERAELRH